MVGCFPWPRRRGASEAKDRMEVDVVDVGSLLDGENRTIPTTAMYSITGGRALAEAIEGVADLVPLPFLSTFVRMSIKVLEACEETTAIEENLKDLQSRVYNLMLVVVDTVPVNKKTSLELQDKISKLQAILDNILADVRKIKEQRKWLLFFFRDLNKERVGRCVNRLDGALQQFNALTFSQVASQLRVEDLLDKIKADYSAFADQLNRIEEAVNRTTQLHSAPSASPMPSLKGKLYGREPLVQEIADLLASENTSHVCITGAGGMGKTSVALSVADSPTIKNVFPKEFIFWVPCVKAASSDLLRQLLYTQLQVTAKAYDSLDTLMLELNATKQRRLVLLDNFQTSWLSGEGENRAEVEDILLRLAKLSHVSLLVTMTSGFPPGSIKWEHRPLSPLDPAAASAAFKSKYDEQAGKDAPVEEGPELDKFLASIGRMPLAIDLTATSGGRLKLSPSDLLQDWITSGTEMMPSNSGMDKTIRSSLEHRFVKDDPKALDLLVIISLLPAGTVGNNLNWWAATVASPHAALEILREAALIEQGDGPFGTARIFVHPTIQSYMLLHHISPEIRNTVYDACYSFVLDHRSIPDHRKFKSDREALAGEEMNIQGLLMETDVITPRPKAIDALVAFAFYQAFTRPSIVVASHALRVAQAVHDNGLVDREVAHHLAEAHHCLGKNYFGLDKFEKACEHFEAARSRFMELPGGADFTRSGECSLELWNAWTFRARKNDDFMVSLLEEARTNLAQDTNNKYSIARGLLAYGRSLWWLNRPEEERFPPLESAIAIFEELDCSASCAECLHLLARTCIDFKKYDMALTFAREGVDKAEQSGVTELFPRILRVVAICLVHLKRHDEAIDVLIRALPLEQASGAFLGLAQALELLAYTRVRTFDLGGARHAYDAAGFHFWKVQPGALRDEGLNRCLLNLEKLQYMTPIASILNITKPDPLY
ncbi:hypothetical protein R3P38DRAFT_2651826 [Favolaschia claudopus]|uniref:NB-ARC domain-containing protein n=1 Tax=Favolaschia claudopus TaxID=2862362 RepID=A0AAW0A4K6_9AGAR